ncbi:translation initiation factor eIF-2B subunit gamma-like [Pollicipes pollicipes]|uniref:translation initiation factor eIF-2B subunit gamma-like n=1 Tax=Pollicipes pollicipes TaxID=41117 RepID=UPI001884FFB2|nr:translation initiation factor eIF-2B subunit gamma-like [Pollicipes pollicipes]XP_037074837.1 translation initiation factor eIF-2B subunit gamma-like [Pollicipes pollicipes]XP_037074838.1 translation initiation factor eIF-2B subunit gamma-like [Pollicipes pollicipes]XP_037074839.1 translation initiation factor eIF-2B subunit gamma-like [Pollicipes pollicipes]XP_037074840.1 translation initiation factor eIF-2B subunit gamma-like [Pollicipes pollicipes]XP_037074841.1 translation initiation fa
MEFKAVILAGGKGSRMTDLTCQMLKCLLPIGGLPMLWYPLRLLQDAGVKSALVVVSEQMKNFQREICSVPQQYELDIQLEVPFVVEGEDPGTADSLRQLRAADRLRANTDLIVLSCDLVTACPLRRLLNVHRLEAAALTALFAAPPVEPDSVTVPGPKTRHKPERDLVGLAEPGPRLCLLASEADFEEEMALRLALLRRHPRLVVRRDLLDAHLYLLGPGLLDFVAKSHALTSVKGEVVPQVIRAQYRRPRAPAADDQTDRPPAAARSANDFLQPARFAALEKPFAEPEEAADAGRATCFAMTTPARTWRANTTAAYLAANRAATRLWAELPEPRPARLHPEAVIPTVKVQISDDSVVGAQSQLSEKTTLERTVVGRHCQLGARVRLVDCIVMDNARVHDDCTLINCVLMASGVVEERCQLRDCLVGVRQTVAAGSSLNREIVSQRGSDMEV